MCGANTGSLGLRTNAASRIHDSFRPVPLLKSQPSCCTSDKTTPWLNGRGTVENTTASSNCQEKQPHPSETNCLWEISQSHQMCHIKHVMIDGEKLAGPVTYLHAQPGHNCHIAERECLVESFFQLTLTDKSC
jgi:hypothetical protein